MLNLQYLSLHLLGSVFSGGCILSKLIVTELYNEYIAYPDFLKVAYLVFCLGTDSNCLLMSSRTVII